MQEAEATRVQVQGCQGDCMTLLEATTVKAGATPNRARARRYSFEHRAFMREHVQVFARTGFLTCNPHSKSDFLQS
jgi:hypothetical protein